MDWEPRASRPGCRLLLLKCWFVRGEHVTEATRVRGHFVAFSVSGNKRTPNRWFVISWSSFLRRSCALVASNWRGWSHRSPLPCVASHPSTKKADPRPPSIDAPLNLAAMCANSRGVVPARRWSSKSASACSVAQRRLMACASSGFAAAGDTAPDEGGAVSSKRSAKEPKPYESSSSSIE